MMQQTLTSFVFSFFCLTFTLASDAEDAFTKPVQRFRLSLEGPDPAYVLPTTGLSDLEPTHRWSCEQVVTFTIPTDIHSVLFEDVTANGHQRVKVHIDPQVGSDPYSAEYLFNGKTMQSILVPIANIADSQTSVSVSFIIPGAQPPGNGDQRNLGLAFRTIALFDTDRPFLCEKPAQDPYPYELRYICGRQVNRAHVYETFPIEKVQQLKTALDEFQQGLADFAVANMCDISDIWEDRSNAIPSLQNIITVISKTPDFVGQLVGEWNEKDDETVKPHVIGSMLWSIFLNYLEYKPDDLRYSMKGELRKRFHEVKLQVRESVDAEYFRQLREVAATHDELTQQAVMKVVNQHLKRKECKRREANGEVVAEGEYKHFFQMQDEYRLLSKILPLIKLPSGESVLQDRLAEQLPLGLKLLRIEALAKEISTAKGL